MHVNIDLYLFSENNLLFYYFIIKSILKII